MKKRFPFIFFIITATIFGLFAFTACGEKESLDFSYTGNSYCVTGIGTVKKKDLIIPPSYNGKPVTAIADYAFWDCKNLASVSIPDSVIDVGELAFIGCDNLQYNEYDNGLYLGNENNPYLLLTCPKYDTITTCKINERTKMVYDGAFYRCENLLSVTVPDGIVSVGVRGFGNSQFLQFNEYDNALYLGNKDNPYMILYKAKEETITACVVNEQVKIISAGAFYGCNELTEITLPESISAIERQTFKECGKLTDVTIPESVKRIGNSAFYSCRSLTDIDIPNGVLAIGNSAFADCGALSNVNLPNGLISIGNKAFSQCKSLYEIIIPESVDCVGDLAFDGCRTFPIYCEAAECPDGWGTNWNMYTHSSILGPYLEEYSVVWNYKKQQ